MSTIDIKALEETALKAMKAAQQIHEAEANIRALHAGAKAAYTKVDNSLPPVDEIVENMRDCVTAIALNPEARSRVYPYSIVTAFTHRTETGASGTPLKMAPGVPYIGPDNRPTLIDLCALMPDVVADAFEQFIRRHAPEGGIPSADKPAILALHRETIEGIEAQHAELVTAAGAVGVVLEPLPENVERQKSEARRAELQRQEQQHLDNLKDRANRANPIN